jgi:hypothetical protein
VDIATKTSIGTDFITPNTSLIGNDPLLIASITSQKSTPVATESPLQSLLIGSSFLTSSLSPTESIVYLNGIGLSPTDSITASTVPLNTDGSIPLVDQLLRL